MAINVHFVHSVQLETPPVGLQPSIPTAMYSVLFPVSALPQSQSFTLTPVDDSIPSEPDEVIGLTFSLISDGRVQRGSDALVTIIDDDDLGQYMIYTSTKIIQLNQWGCRDWPIM